MLAGFTKFALQCLKQVGNKLELRETAVTYFADLTVLVKEDITEIFDEVMDEILKTCNTEDEFKEQYKNKDGAKGFSLDSDSEEEDMLGMDIDVACLDEKSAAVNAIGQICLHAPVTCQRKMTEIADALEHL